MKNSNVKNLQIQEITNEIMDKIIEGKNPDIESFLLDGMSSPLNHAFVKERELFLNENLSDKSNGFLPNRKVNLGTNAIEIAVPRTRNLGFYPSMLPKYSRNIGSEYQNILESIILNSKSFRSIADGVRSLGLSYSLKQIESLVNDLFEEAKKYNSRQLECDYAFIYIDAKVIDINDESGQIKKAVHFTAIGVNLEMRKELLLSQIFYLL